MTNIIKIICLGLICFSVLVYFTMPSNNINNDDLSIKSLPKYFEIIGKNKHYNTQEYFKHNTIKYLIILNHDSLFVFKNFYKKYKKNDVLFIANISNYPWLLKQLSIRNELEKMYKESKIYLISDSYGDFIDSLKINNNSQNSYFVYKILENNKIEKIHKGEVKFNAMQEGINIKELNIFENELYNLLNNYI